MRVGARCVALVALLALAFVLVLVLAASTPRVTVQTRYPYENFTVSHPEAWRTYPYEALGSLGGYVGYLSTDTLSDPCHRTGTSTNCQNAFLLPHLSATGVLVEWIVMGSQRPVDVADFDGEPLVVDGAQARLGRLGPADESCLEFGGTREVVGTVVFPPSAGAGVLQMWVCFGPRAGTSAELAAGTVFRSLRFDSFDAEPAAPGVHGASARLLESLRVV